MEEEVAVFAVTDYKVAFFMSRSPDVTDKRIRISEPVWWDQANPSAKAYWLRFMQLAAQRHSGTTELAACMADISIRHCLDKLRYTILDCQALMAAS